MTAGAFPARDRRSPAAGDLGLTLLEMVIVLAVIAVAAGATTLALAPRRGDATEAEARLLAAAMQAAVDRDIATGATAALVVDDGGYTVGGTRHALPAGTTLAGMPGPLTIAGGRPFDLAVTRGAERWTVSFDGLRVVAAAAKDAT